MELEQIARVLEELGPLVPAIDAVQQEKDRHWVIAWSGEHLLHLDAVPERGIVRVSATLAKPAEEDPQDLYQSLLLYNFLALESGGYQFALDGDENLPVLSCEFAAVCCLQVSNLGLLIGRFIERVQVWNHILTSPPPEATGEPRLPDLSTLGPMLEV